MQQLRGNEWELPCFSQQPLSNSASSPMDRRQVFWAFPSGFPIPIKNCREAFQQPLDISQRLSYTLLVLPNSCPTAFKSISQQLLAKTWQCPSLFSGGPHFLKVKARFENLKSHQRLLFLIQERSIKQHNFQTVSISCDRTFNRKARKNKGK